MTTEEQLSMDRFQASNILHNHRAMVRWQERSKERTKGIKILTDAIEYLSRQSEQEPAE